MIFIAAIYIAGYSAIFIESFLSWLFAGFMGSLVSVGQWMESDAGGLSQGDGYISNVQRKQIFTQTGL